jgi:hypothetical protein
MRSKKWILYFLFMLIVFPIGIVLITGSASNAPRTPIKIWPSRASEEGKWNAVEVSGYQQGESAMICVACYSGCDKVGTVRVKNAVTGNLVYERSNFLKNMTVTFYHVVDLPSGSYIATVSTEAIIRVTTNFRID